MKATKLIPMLWTNHFQETIDFYTQIIGFTCDERNEQLNWASLHLDDVELMVAVPNEHMTFEKPIFTGSFYFRVEDVDHMYMLLKDSARLVYPIENFEWEMREFAIYDNNGYILQFGQEIKA